MTTHTAAADTDAAEVLAARAASLATPLPHEDDGETIAVVPFTVGGTSYAVDATAVREVRPLTDLARVPRAPVTLLGVTRVRSTIVPVFDLAAILDVGQHAAGDVPPWVVVLEGDSSAAMGLAADAVRGVERHPQGAISPAVEPTGEPGGVAGITADGVAVLDAQFLLTRPPAFGGPTAEEDRSRAPGGGHATSDDTEGTE